MPAGSEGHGLDALRNQLPAMLAHPVGRRENLRIKDYEIGCGVCRCRLGCSVSFGCQPIVISVHK